MDPLAAQKAALGVLVEILASANTKPELRIEAAKIILNRPRFFVDDQFPER